MRWSIEGQTAEFLAATRMASLSDSIIASVLGQIPLEAGASVLDVGCGSGEYTFRLGANVAGVLFTGCDCDAGFVGFAGKRVRGEVGYPFEEPNPANEYRFVCGDGCALPFDDASFDAVVSHTYLTAVADWRQALAEMARVCKPGGTVSSMASMTGDFYGTGTVGLFAAVMEPGDIAFLARMAAAKSTCFKSMEITAGIAPRDVPAAFARAGLANVRCVPIGQYFCLSDASLSTRDYLRHVDLLCAVEEEELGRLAPSISKEDRARYAELIAQRRGELVDMAGSNREWNWYGNSALLVCGEVA